MLFSFRFIHISCLTYLASVSLDAAIGCPVVQEQRWKQRSRDRLTGPPLRKIEKEADAHYAIVTWI